MVDNYRWWFILDWVFKDGISYEVAFELVFDTCLVSCCSSFLPPRIQPFGYFLCDSATIFMVLPGEKNELFFYASLR